MLLTGNWITSDQDYVRFFVFNEAKKRCDFLTTQKDGKSLLQTDVCRL